MRIVVVIIMMLLLQLSTPVDAANTLYRSSVELDQQLANPESLAMRQAMRRTLIKVSGQVDIVNHSKIRSAIRKPENYVSKYQYTRNAAGARLVDVEFESQRIDSLISSAGLLPWKGRRPVSLIWLAVQKSSVKRHHKSIVAEQQHPEIATTMFQHADDRGIELLLPIADLKEQQQISVNDVWGQFDSVVLNASQRYFAGNVVSARLFPKRVGQVNLWQLDWRQLKGNVPITRVIEAETEQLAVAQLIHQLAESMSTAAKQHAEIGANSNRRVDLLVSNLDTIEQYQAALRLLVASETTRTVVLARFQNGNAHFNLQLSGSLMDLQQDLEIDGRLLKQRDEFGILVDDLDFIWRP